MNSNTLGKRELSSVFTSILVGFLVIWVMEPSPYRELFAILMALITYTLTKIHESEIPLEVKSSMVTREIPEIIWVVALTIALLLSFAQMPSDPEFVSWSEISPLRLLRALAFYPLVIFYPGYFLVNLLVSGKRCMSLADILTLSIFGSYFFGGIMAFLVWFTVGSVIFATSFLVLLINALFLTITLFRKYKMKEEVKVKEKSLDLFTLGILGGAVFFVAMGTYAISMPDHFTYGFDIWDLWGIIHRTISGVPELTGYNYFLFKFFNALIVISPGLPLINSYLIVFLFLTPLRVLAFYIMCSSVISKRQSALATLIYATFSGLGGLYSIFLRVFLGIEFWTALWNGATKCYDIEVGVQGYNFLGQPITVSYCFPFIFLYLAFSKNYPRLSRITLMALSFAAGYLTELSVIPILLVVVFFLVLFNTKIIDKVLDVYLSELLGLLVSFGILNLYASVLPVSIKYNSPLFQFFPYLVVILITTTVLAYLKTKSVWSKWTGIMSKVTKAAKVDMRYKAPTIISVLCIYFLLVLLTFWIYIPPELANYKLFGGTVPWIFYPVKLGLPLFISVIMIPRILRKGDSHVLKLGMIIVLVPIMAGNLESFIREHNIAYIEHTENRWLHNSWSGFSILASYGLWELLQKVRGQSNLMKKIAYSSLLIFILISSVSSSILTIETHRSYISHIKMSKEEVNIVYASGSILDYSGIVAGPTEEVQRKIEFYVPRVTLDEPWNQIFFGSIYPNFFSEAFRNNPYSIIASGDSGHWYMLKPLKEKYEHERGLALGYLTEYLPILQENEWFILYDLPKMSPSPASSSTAFMSSLISEREEQRIRTIIDDNQTTFWTITPQHPGEYGLQMEDSNTTKIRGGTSLLLNVTHGSYARLAISHDYLEPQDWSDYDFISFYWYGTMSKQHTIGIIMYAPDPNNHLWFEWDDTFIGWKKLKVRLSDFYRHGNPDLKNVTHVEIKLWPEHTRIYYLDSLALEKEASDVFIMYTREELVTQLSLSLAQINYTVFSTFDPGAYSSDMKVILMAHDPQHPSDRLLSWIKKGGNLVIFQGENWNSTHLLGSFSREVEIIPSENMTLLDGLSGSGGAVRLPLVIKGYLIKWSADATPIAWYTKDGKPVTPYALQKNFGEGKVIYVITTPYLDVLNRSGNTTEGRALFSHLKGLIDVLGLPLQRYQEKSSSIYAFIVGSALLDNGKIEARGFLPIEAGSPMESVYFQNVDIFIENSKLNNVTLNECKIESLKNLIISFNQALLVPSHLPECVKVQLAGPFNLTLIPEPGTKITLYTYDGTHTSTISTQNIVRLMVHRDKEETTEFYLKAPEFSVASARFENIMFDFFSGINNPGLPMKVNNGMKFKIQNADENFALATNISIGGTYEILALETKMRESRWIFPREALLSPVFWLLTYITGEYIVKLIRKKEASGTSLSK